jgi:signal transduction histidine kinase/CheY-like chemotaxis protein
VRFRAKGELARCLLAGQYSISEGRGLAEANTRVLIVDDSADDRQWLVSLLREARVAAEIAHADSLASAERELASGGFELVITDHSMPDGSGVELASHPRVVADNLPVIVITGQEQPNQGSEALERGAADFLPKDDLTARALARACAHARARRSLEAEVEASRHASEAARRDAEHALAEANVALARVRALQTLTAALSVATTREEVTASALRDGALIYERANAGTVFELLGSELKLRSSFGIDEGHLDLWRTVPLGARTPLADAVRDGDIVCIPNVAALSAQYGELPVQEGSWVTVPLVREQQKLGVLVLRYQTDQLPDGAWLEYLKLVGGCISDALIRARYFEDAQASAAHEERLLAIVGHDLRTPLSAINFGVTIMRSEAPEHPVLARLERSVRSMSDLISDILSRAELRRGREPEAGVTLADSETVLREQIDELRAAFPRSRLELSIDVPEPEQCDPVRLSQLVTNLVRNALQHGDASAPVTVTYTAHDDTTTLSVHNFGTPIPEDQLPQLFNPFARGRKSRGTGLGLYIVHETVLALGGQVNVSSDAGGTTFTLELPRDCWTQRLTMTPSPPGAAR